MEELTRILATPPPFPLPHAPLPLSTLLVAEDAIRHAWVRLRQKALDDFDLSTADEDEVTLKLHEVLVDEIYSSGQVAGFDDTLMQIGSREAKFRNFDGRRPDKMPDLHIGIIGRSDVRRSQDGIFVECKPVDRNHTVGTHYCNEGISRFVCGDYAWAMTSAMMVAYASEGYEIDPKLIDALTKSDSILTTSMPTKCGASQTILFCEQTYVTFHERDFTYVESDQPAPDIVLRHLWLRR